MNKRLAAFTIMELTVSMLLAALVISITYTALTIVTRSYQGFSQKNGELAVLTRLDELLKKDFSAAQGIYKTARGITLPGAAPDALPVRYEFGPDWVLRRTGLVTDTFKVVSVRSQMLFEGREIEQDTEEEGTPSEASRADELSLELVYKDEKFPYHYYKTYSSENLIKRKTHADHLYFPLPEKKAGGCSQFCRKD